MPEPSATVHPPSTTGTLLRQIGALAAPTTALSLL
jgi:hypothetical protein